MGFKEAHGLRRFKESGSDLLHEQLAADFVFHKSTAKGKWMVFLSLNFPPTHFSQLLRGKQSPLTLPNVALSPERAPVLCLCLLLSVWTLNANWGSLEFTRASNLNFELKIIKGLF